MRKLYLIIFPLMLFFIIGVPVYLLVARIYPEWDEIFIGALMTAFSLIGGIPIGLWVNRQIIKEEENKEYKKDRKTELDLLEQIEEELNWNLDRVADEKRSIQGNFDPLKSEYWEVMKSSALLNKIKNPKLLNRIASTYFVVNYIIFLESGAVSHFDKKNAVLDINSRWKALVDRSVPYHALLKTQALEARKMIKKRKKELEILN